MKLLPFRYTFNLLFLLISVCIGRQSVAFAADDFPAGAHQPDARQSIEGLRRSYDDNPYNPVIKRNLATAVLMRGIDLLKQKRYQDAAAQFEYAEELLPDDSQTFFLRGSAVYQLRQYDLARTEFEKALARGGDSAEVLFMLGKVFYDTEEIREAVALWERAAQIDPGNKALQDLLVKAKRELAVDEGMGKGHSSRFILSYDTATKSDIADKVLDVLEDAYNLVGRDFGVYPVSRVPVILYTGRDYRAITGSPDWSGGQYDGKIRLPVGGMSEVSPVVRAVLFHEYTHVVVREITGGNCPTWLNEGLAEVEGRREYAPPLPVPGHGGAPSKLISLQTLTGPFTSLQGKNVELAYQQSYSLVNYMISAYGWHTMKELLSALGEGFSFEAAAARAYEGVGRSFDEIAGEWREQFTASAGRPSE